jgi:hypothetical protein
MERLEAKTRKNRLMSNIMASALFSGAKMKIADKYCATIITGILYPRTTENILMIFMSMCFDFRVNMGD